MQQNYSAFIRRVIEKYEGGYGWDRADAGGPTNFGITCYDYAEFLGEKMHSMSAWAPRVKAMPLDVAEQIYANKYAKRDRFNDLESGSDCVVLDFGINSGIYRPIWFAQRMGGRKQENKFSDELVKAINDGDAVDFINEMCDMRMAFLQKLRNWPTFKRGWTARVADLRAYCTRLARPGLKAAAPLKDPIIKKMAKGMSKTGASAAIRAMEDDNE